MIHYWSFNGNLTRDEIGKANLLNGLNTILIKDRLGKPNSALGLKNGYIKIPSGIYFDCDFTITLWIKLISIGSYTQILSFGNGNDNDNVNLFLNDGIITLEISSQKNIPSFTLATSNVKINEWTHVAVVLNGNNSRIYYDSSLMAFSFSLIDPPKYVIRKLNFIGDLERNFEIYYDEIKVFNRALNQYDIEKEADIHKGIYKITLLFNLIIDPKKNGKKNLILIHKLLLHLSIPEKLNKFFWVVSSFNFLLIFRKLGST